MMNNQITNYNINNILKIQVIRNKKVKFINEIDLELSYFEVNEKIDPDITLYLGNFKPNNADCFKVDTDFLIKDNYFYCKDSFNTIKWETEIYGFEKGKTAINFNYKLDGIRNYFSLPSIEAQILRQLIYKKITERNIVPIHAAGVSINNCAYIFPGRGGSFKTTVAMNLIKQLNYSYLGDDWILLSRDFVYPFLINQKIINYLYKYKDNEKLDLLDKIKILINIVLKENIYKMNVAQPSKLKSIIFLSKSKSFSLKTLNRSEACNKLILNNQIEMKEFGGLNLFPYFRYLTYYSYIYPYSSISYHRESISDELNKILYNIPIYELKFPLKYSSTYLSEILKILNGELI